MMDFDILGGMGVVVGVFAHPDDEAFGPGGTLAKFAQNNDVYVICATNGETATGEVDKALAKIRRAELRASCKILGVKKVYFLGFTDGTLSNNLYHTIAGKVKKILHELKPETLLTFEPRGVSGHIDHIVMSMVTQFIFPDIKSAKKLMMHCLTFQRSQLMHGKYFIYFPFGYKDKEIDEVIDVSDIWETKVQAMQQHASQIHDVTRILEQSQQFPKKEYFLVEEKTA